MKKNIQIIKDNKLIYETTEGLSGILFLYTNIVGKFFRFLINNKAISKIYGFLQNSRLSRYKINKFVKKHKIQLDDFIQPPGGYKSFNQFFIRKLKPGGRVIDKDSKTIISPADSKLFVIQEINNESKFFVKNINFKLTTFLNSYQLAQEYNLGTLMIFRLAPYDYHRFHFPTHGIAEEPIKITGRLDSVNPIVYKSGVMPLISNERHLIKFHTELFDTVLIIPVGALLVGKIVNTYQPNKTVQKADEIGYFEFGGSTVVLLFKKNKVNPIKSFINNSINGFETVVKMGEIVSN